jgi:6-phosphogluconolactonase (cycloisomerase 2 family)
MLASRVASKSWVRGAIAAGVMIAIGACVGAGDGDELTMGVDQDVVKDGGTGRLDVFVLDNSAERNAVIAYHRNPTSGALERVAAFPTGGKGTAAGLGSQGAVILDEIGTHVFAVNPGSDEISVFEIRGPALVLRDIVPSGGANPISLTVSGDLLYVLNAGRDAIAGSIAGFRLGDESMAPIAGSVRPLSAAAAGPAQIQFTPDGDVLVVTEKATNNLTTYLVDVAGAASAPIVTPSHGQTPFGFAFAEGTLVVSEAFGGAPGASAMSSYAIGADGVPTVLSGSVANGQGASCWVAISRGTYAYATNTASDTVSGYRVRATGELVLFGDGGVTAVTASRPTDADFNAAGTLLYVLDGGSDAIDIFKVQPGGALASVARLTGLPAATVGLAAR